MENLAIFMSNFLKIDTIGERLKITKKQLNSYAEIQNKKAARSQKHVENQRLNVPSYANG